MMISEDSTYPSFDLPDPDLHFLASENSLYDYAHLYGFCSHFRKKLKSSAITPEKPLALFSESSDKLTFAIAACYLLNIPFVTINPQLTDRELDQQIKTIKPALFLVDSSTGNRVDTQPVIEIKTEDLTQTAGADTAISPSQSPDDLLGYFFTSGSTGSPKVVPVKRRQILFASAASAKNFKPDPERYWLLCLPLYHIGGLSIILRSIHYHSAIYRMDSFDENQVRTFLNENKLFQVASLVPTMLIRLMDDPLFKCHLDFKAVLLGGGPISISLIDNAQLRGIPIVSSYGLTETCAQIAANPMLKPSGVYSPKKSVGKIYEPNQVQIRDPETGKVHASNENGEIWLKGPQVFDGYADDELNKKAFDANGWFNTGDIGRLNRVGQLFVIHRQTGRIVTGGENVDPAEVESALNKLPDIDDSAVLGIEDPEWGNRVVALVVPANDVSINTEQIREQLRERLSRFKHPKEIVTVPEIPKTSLEKIRQGSLLELYHKAGKNQV